MELGQDVMSSATRLVVEPFLWEEGDTTWLVEQQIMVQECAEGMTWSEWERDEDFETLQFDTEAEALAEVEQYLAQQEQS